MKNIFAGLLCVGLCIAVAVFIPKVGTSNPDNDPTGCLECHDVLGEGGLHETHSGFDCEVCHGETTAGPVGLDACRACHDEDLCDLVNLHGAEAGCLAMGCHDDCELTEGCTVTIDCETTELCPDDECTTCSAATVCDGATTEGTYTWELNGTVTTGNSLDVCPEALNDGSNTVTATDTANGDAEDTEMIEFNGSACQEPTDCSVEVITLLPVVKSNWFAIPQLLRIQVGGFELRDLIRTPANIECEFDQNGVLPLNSVLNTGKVVQPVIGSDTAIIWQTAIVWPTWVTQSGNAGGETCTVTVGDCGDTGTLELTYLPFFLSEQWRVLKKTRMQFKKARWS